jgi:hypothetical protein
MALVSYIKGKQNQSKFSFRSLTGREIMVPTYIFNDIKPTKQYFRRLMVYDRKVVRKIFQHKRQE